MMVSKKIQYLSILLFLFFCFVCDARRIQYKIRMCVDAKGSSVSIFSNANVYEFQRSLCTPVVSGVKVYFVNSKSQLVCSDIRNGYKYWVISLPKGNRYFISYEGKNLYICVDKTLLKVSAIDGKVDSTVQLAQIAGCRPIIKRGHIFVNELNNVFQALCISDLKSEWIYTDVSLPMSFFGMAVPLVVDDGVIFFSSTGSIFFLKDGYEVWQVSLIRKKANSVISDHIIANPTVVKNNLFVASANGVIACLNIKLGEILWEASIDDNFTNSLLLVDDFIFIVSRNVIRCFSSKNGEMVWAKKLYKNQKRCKPFIGMIVKKYKIFVIDAFSISEIDALTGKMINVIELKDRAMYVDSKNSMIFTVKSIIEIR